MGLFTALVTLPLAPVRGVAWIAEQVGEEADRQLYDENRIRGELLRLELDRDSGLVDEREYELRTRELLERLVTARERRGPQTRQRWETEDDDA